MFQDIRSSQLPNRKGRSLRVRATNRYRTRSPRGSQEETRFSAKIGAPRFGLKYTLYTEFSGYEVCCALLEEQPDGKHLPVGYWSRTLRRGAQL